ncbi:hypothetical protein ACFLXD_01535 [Chloroflexota bacterium]
MKSKRKLTIFIGALLLALTVSVGSYAYTWDTATATLDVVVAGAEAVTTTVVPDIDQPDWDSLLPESEYDLETLRPDGEGDEDDIDEQYPDSGEHWDKVDDTEADGDSTYVFTDKKQWEEDFYSLTDHLEGEGAIEYVTVYMQARAEADPSQSSAAIMIRTDGTEYVGNDITVTTDYSLYSYQWSNNPATGNPWSWEQIDDLEIGAKLRRAAKNVETRLTQMYIVVGYEMPPIIDGDVPKGDIYEITPHEDYTGDMLVNVYLTNTGAVNLAYQHLNMKVYIANSLEADGSPHYQVLSLENGVVIFNIEGGAAASYTIEIIGGGYNLTSGDTAEWGEGWSIAPEFYCEVSQR